MKTIGLMLIAFLMLAPANLSLAAESSAPVDVGNKVCPFMNAPIADGGGLRVEYKGKVYHVCCAMCKEMFLKDPEAAVKKFDAMMADEKSK